MSPSMDRFYNNKEFRDNAESITSINYHYIFITKEHAPLLTGAVAYKMQNIILDLVVEHGWTIIAIEILIDHIHLLINVGTTESPKEIATWIKNRSTYTLKKEFPHIQRLPTVWGNRFFVASVGRLTTEELRRYIEGIKKTRSAIKWRDGNIT